jgi:predicted XRE-type DNA-binding protein
MNDSTSLIPFQIPHYPQSISLVQARVDLPPEEFRLRLRSHLQDHPGLTLAQVGRAMGVTRQRVSLMVGPLARPNCCQADHPAPKRDRAARHLAELCARVAAGESAGSAAKALGISLLAASRLGFRVKAVRPPHGHEARACLGCDCWLCRRAAGVSRRRSARAGERTKAEIHDWLAWTNPEDGRGLSQEKVGQLVGVSQAAVSRVARAVGE